MHQSLYLRNYSFVATLSLVWWEYLTTCDDEYNLIWRRPINSIKCIFLFSRYIPLIVTMTNFTLLFGPLSYSYVDASTCRAWFAFLFSSSLALYIAMELLLIAKVYALYQRNTKVALYLCTLMAIEIVLQTRFIVAMLQYGTFRTDNCDAKGIPLEVFYFSGCLLLFQFSLWFMTYFRRNIVSRTVPVIRVVIRDAFSASIIICALVPMGLLSSTISNHSVAHVVYNWPPVLISVMTCRMIVNLQRINVGRAASANSVDESQMFTTCFESRSSTA